MIALLEEQLRLSALREKSLLEQLALQSIELHQQSIQIQELIASVRSLEEALLLKNGRIQTLTGKNRGLGKLISNKSEKVTPDSPCQDVAVPVQPPVVNLKDRGNNNAKRKEFFDMETIIEEVYPDDPGFDKEKARVIGYVDSILEDDYLSMDESYYTVLTKDKNHQGKGVRKGYIWAALGNSKKLVHYFYDNGSRSREVLTNYIGTQYTGAIQSDGLINYKILETDAYPNVIRLACFQHCKRTFLDIEGDEDAKEIVDIINSLYREEHKTGKDWKPDKILKHRQRYALPILERLKRKLLRIQADPATLPKSPLAKAVNYTLD